MLKKTGIQHITRILILYKILHLESTDVCNLACPACAREVDPAFRKDSKHHLTVEQIHNHISESEIAQLDKMFMCGNYGDPAAGYFTASIFQYFRKINPDITLGMNTNGSLRDTKWWEDLATILNHLKDYVVFSIDGLEDTNHVYRKNVNWDRVINNARTFIEAGGNAQWDMLVYEHNQHQVDACEQLARDMGFKWFRAKVSKRPFVNGLEFPIGWKQSQIVAKKVDCHALKEQSVYIDAQGRTSPCCWLGDRQKDFIKDFESVQQSWSSLNPNIKCLETCGTDETTTSFNNQWQREVQLC